jgi:hypothetical protein
LHVGFIPKTPGCCLKTPRLVRCSGSVLAGLRLPQCGSEDRIQQGTNCQIYHKCRNTVVASNAKGV